MSATVIASKRRKTADEIRDEVDLRYASFCRRPMSEGDVWALGMATMVMPDGNPGAEAYLAQVAGVDCFHGRLTVWGRVVAIGIAASRYRGQGGVRRGEYVPGYDESWGRFAVADGLTLAIYGRAMPHDERPAQLMAGKQGYRRIRDFVGSGMVCAIEEFRVALEWALGYRRDRVLQGRWEGITGLSWDKTRADANMVSQGVILFQMFAPGCKQTPLARTDQDQDRLDPETLYHGLRPTDWWDAAYARWMRSAPVTTIQAPPAANQCPNPTGIQG